MIDPKLLSALGWVELEMATNNFIAFKPYSSNNADYYLWVVIRINPYKDKEFVVHTFNSETQGYSNGFYCDTLEAALKDFNERGGK